MKNKLLLFFIVALMLSSCASSKRSAEQMPTSAPVYSDGGVADVQSFAPAEAPVAQENATFGTSASGIGELQKRLVVQNADLSVVVKDPEAKLLEIGALAGRLGGYVVSSSTGQTYTASNIKVPEGNINVRIPAEKLDEALLEIKKDVVEVQSENRFGEDVTNQYVDLQSQLKAKQAAADKLYEIMDQAVTAEDTLAVFNQLSQVQSEIEVLKGQIKYFEEAAALSAVSVRLIAEESIQPVEVAGWKPKGVARDAVQALVDFFQGFADFLIWLAIFILPVAAIVIVLLALLWRLGRWFWKKVFPRKTPPPAAKAE